MNASQEAKANINKVKNFLTQIDHTFVTTNPKVTSLNKNNFNNIHYFIKVFKKLSLLSILPDLSFALFTPWLIA